MDLQELRATLLACGLRVVDSLGNLVTHLDECVLTLGADKVGPDGSSRRRRLFGAADGGRFAGTGRRWVHDGDNFTGTPTLQGLDGSCVSCACAADCGSLGPMRDVDTRLSLLECY